MRLENTNRLFLQQNLVNRFVHVFTIFDYRGRSVFPVPANALLTPPLGVFNMGSRLSEHIAFCYFFCQTYCTQTVSDFVQEVVHTEKRQVYNKLYGTHCQRHVVSRAWHRCASSG